MVEKLQDITDKGDYVSNIIDRAFCIDEDCSLGNDKNPNTYKTFMTTLKDYFKA